MAMNKDMARRLSQKSRYWNRRQREKLMRKSTVKDHSREFSSLINLEKATLKQNEKLHRMHRL